MIELSPLRKNKINLEDYDYQKDIQNRLLLAELTVFEVEVLEEILYSPLKIPTRRLARGLDVTEEKLMPTLLKLEPLHLFFLENNEIHVDKEARKYYELEIMKFDEDFKPDMEYIYGFLKKVPIHTLPIWYSIPRTSNNIFESIIEKFLSTPQIYQRYCMELGYNDPVFNGIMEEVFSSTSKIRAKEIREKYDLSHEAFEEYMLHLEFNFICSLSYSRSDDHWEEVITPFHEWREYLTHIQNAHPTPIANTSLIERKRPSNFAFVEEITKILKVLKSRPLTLEKPQEFQRILKIENLETAAPYLDELMKKMEAIRLIEITDGNLHLLDSVHEWMEMSTETKALYLYRHPLNTLISAPYAYVEKQLKEAEKSIKSVIDHGWVLFDDFIDGAIIPLDESKRVVLTKRGKGWKYTLPEYSDEDKSFIKASLFEGLFQAGMIATGKLEGKDCFTVTPFGQTFFGS